MDPTEQAPRPTGKSHSLLKDAAVLAKKKAALASITTVALPRLYHAIGKRLAPVANLPADLETLRTKIRQLEANLAAKVQQQDAAPSESLASRAKALAAKASKVAGDAATSVQLQAAYVALGKQAVVAYGAKAVPKELREELAQTQDQAEVLAKEIAAIEAVGSSGFLTPRRLVLAGAAVTLLVCGLFVFRIVGSVFGGGTRHPAVPRASDIASQIADDLSRSLSRGGSDPVTESAGDTRQDIARRLSDRLDELFKDWESKTEKLTTWLGDEPSLAGFKDELGRSPWGDSALSALASKETDSARTIRSRDYPVLRKATYDRPAAIEEQKTATLRDADDSAAAYQKDCERSLAEITAARKASIANVTGFLTDYMGARKKLSDALTAALDKEIGRWEESVRQLSKSAPAMPNKQVTLSPDSDSALEDTQRSLRQQWDEDVQARDKAIRAERADVLRRFKEDLTPQSVSRAEEVVENTSSQFEKKITLTVEQLSGAQQRNLAAIERRLDELVHKDANQQKAERLASRKPNQAVSVPETATDQDIAEIARNAPDVTTLDLISCKRLTDACFDSLAQMKHLRWLRLPEVPALTPSGFVKLKDLKFEYFDGPIQIWNDPDSFGVIMRARFGHRTPDDTGAVRLNHIWLEYGDRGLQQSAGVTIHVLHLPFNGITDDGLMALHDIKELSALEVQLTSRITDKGIASLSACKSLRKLHIQDVSDGGQRIVDRKRSPMTWRGIEALSGMRLEELEIPAFLYTEDCFPHYLNAQQDGAHRGYLFASHGSKVVAKSVRWPFTAKTIGALAGKKGVRHVRIEGSGSEVNADEIIALLWDIPDLQELSIEHVRLTGAGFADVRKARALRDVSLLDTVGLTDEALKRLGECESLGEVFIRNAPQISAEGLMSLSGCKNLQSVHVSGTKVRVGDAAGLQSRIKGCRVFVGNE